MKEVTAKTKEAYAKTFTVTTKELTATAKEVGKDATKDIYFDAKDQYGNAIKVTEVPGNLKSTVTYNNLPLKSTDEYEVKATNGKLVVQIKEGVRVLAKDAKVAIKLEVVDADNKVIETSTANFTVVEGEAAAPTTVEAVTATYAKTINEHKADEAVTEVLPNDEIKLTADVKDQYGNPVTTVAKGKNLIRWVVKEGKDFIATSGETDLTSGSLDTNDNTVSFKAVKPGTLTIEAYNIANGDYETYTVEIGASKLTAITVGKELTDNGKNLVANPYNNEEGIVAVLTADPTGAALKAEDVKFDVKPGKGLTKEDITVTAEEITVGKGDDAKKHIVVKATTKKAGTYSVTPFVGEAIDADKVAKGEAIEVKTTLNPVVESFEIEPVKENEVNVKGIVTKALTFKNKHGEEIKVGESKVTVTSSDNDVATAEAVDNKEGNATIKLTGVKEGDVTVTVVAGKVSKQLTFKVVGAAKIDKVSLGNAITDGVYQGSNEKVVQVIEVKDQFGNDFIPENTTDITLTTDPSVENFATVSYYKVDEKTGEISTDSVDRDAAKGVALVISAEKVEKLEADKKVKVTATVEGKEVSKVDVTVKPAAALKEVKATAKTTQVAQGASTVVRVVPTDQYGNVVAGLVEGITLVDESVFKIAASGVKEVKEGDKTVGYDVTITTVEGAKPGKSTVEFKAAKDGANASAKIDFTVVEAIEAIGSVEIKEVEGLQNAAPENGVKLEAIVKDKDDQVLEVTAKDLTWSITGVKDAKGNALTVTEDKGTYTVTLADEAKTQVKLTITDGVLATDTKDSLKGLTIDVAVQVETANFKTAETTVTITNEAPAYKEGFKIEKAFEGKPAQENVAEAKEVKVENNIIEITDEATQAVTLTFTGTDQYGDIFGIAEDVTATSASSLATDDKGSLNLKLTEDAEAETALQTITITSTTGEDGKVYISYGKERLELDVKVSASVKAIAEAKSAIAAIPTKVTVADAAAIEAARDAFDKLTEEQKTKLAEEKAKLEAAETTLK